MDFAKAGARHLTIYLTQRVEIALGVVENLNHQLWLVILYVFPAPMNELIQILLKRKKSMTYLHTIGMLN